MRLRKQIPQETRDPEPVVIDLLAPQVVDQLVERYVSWREECATATESYRSWSAAGNEERDAAYVAYIAALDREEAAARAYRVLIEQVRAA